MDIYAQRVNASGAVQWTANGVALCTASGDQQNPKITTDGAGGAIVTWYDQRSESGIYAQRVNASGAAQWTTDGVALYTATGGSTESFQITSDGAGGAIVSWSENRSWDYDIYAQRVNASGAVQWTADGVALCTAARVQYSPQIVSDGAGGATVTWRDDRSGSNYDIYAQRVDALGAVQWTIDGVALCTATGDQGFPQITFDGAGGAIVSWYDYRSGNWDIYAQRVDAAGHTVVATLLQNYAATFSGDRIAITWTLSEIDEGVEFSVERATASDGPFIELPSSALRQNRLSFTFSDGDWQPNMSYWYRVEYQIDNERKVLFETGPIATPAPPLTLYQNNPNPFNPSTTIGYYIPEKCLVRLEVFDVAGARVAGLVSSEQPSGYHSVQWKGTDAWGNQVASGVYFYRLTAGKKTISRKMVLLQ
jgi:predicted lipoprotein with Yx(FWY)xxD motif